MTWRGFLRLCAAAILAAAAVPQQAAVAQTSAVPYVATPSNVVDVMLKMARVGPADYVVDLGSGDGRIVIAAAKKHGARGFGVEIEGGLVNTARREAERQGVADRAEFHERSLYITDISRATVLTLYLFPSINLQLRPRLFTELKPGTRVVSHEFDMGKWQADERVTVDVSDKHWRSPSSEVFLWIVPANAAGTWQWRFDLGGTATAYELQLEQTFQMLAGKPVVSGRAARLEGARMRGDEIRFILVADMAGRETRQEFSGRISGDAIVGRMKSTGGAEIEWSAARMRRGSIDISH